jgi:hypothetical protein
MFKEVEEREVHPFNLWKPAGYFTYHQFNIQEFYVVDTLSLHVLYGSQNQQQIFPFTALTDWFL